MLELIAAVFVGLHGLVHLLYAGQSWRAFELQPGMAWPEGSWALSRLFTGGTLRRLVGLACVLICSGFVAGAIALIWIEGWWRSTLMVSTVLSSLVYLLAWDGRGQGIIDQGGFAVVINLILIALFLL